MKRVKKAAKSKLPTVIQKMKTIEEVHEYYQKIIQCMPNNVYWLDENCITQGCNQNVLDFIGLKNIEDFVGINYEEMGEIAGWTDGHEKKYKKDDQAVIKSGKAKLNIEDPPVLTPDGKELYYLSSRVPLFDKNNKVIGIVGISVDISEMKQKEKELQEAKKKAEAASKAKDEFIRNMSHDIRTPLSGIIGMSNLLEQDAHTSEERENAHMLNVSGEQLLTLLNSVLDMIASGSQKENQVNKAIFNPEELIHNVADLELPTIKLKGLNLRLNLSDNLPHQIESDPTKIHRILLNLLGNSVKFTEQGEVEIGARLVEESGASQRIEFYIKDTGTGIKPEDKDQVFKKFFKGNSSYHGIFTGHGVGLHIVKRYAHLLKGKISLDSEFGQGTTITVSIPVKVIQKRADAQKPVTGRQPNSIAETTSSYSSVNILLIEDNPVALKMAENLLKQMGFSYQSAINGASAIEYFKNESFDMVLSDLGLPDIQGMDVCRQLRAHEKETGKRAIPIVGLTAHSVADIEEEGKATGMNQVLTKPIRREIVEELLATYSLNKNSKEASSPSPAPSNPDSPEHLPLLDEALAMSYLGGKDEVKELIEIMLNQSIPDTVTSIEQQYEAQNWPDFKKAVHKFKSSCMYCATSRLLHHTKNLESLADTGNQASIKPEYESFLSCLDITRDHLEHWLQNCQ